MNQAGPGQSVLVRLAIDQHQVHKDVAIAAVIEHAAKGVIVEAGRQGRVGREHVDDFDERSIEAVAELVLLMVFEIPAEVTGRFNRPHCILPLSETLVITSATMQATTATSTCRLTRAITKLKTQCQHTPSRFFAIPIPRVQNTREDMK